MSRLQVVRIVRTWALAAAALSALGLSARPAPAAPPSYRLIPLPSPLPAPNGGYESRGLGVNNSGRSVGSADRFLSSNNRPAWGVSWSPAGLPDTVFDPFSNFSTQRSSALGINDAGVVVGAAQASTGSGSGSLVAARWLPGSSTPIALPTPGNQVSGFVSSLALGVNSGGAIVGWSNRYDDQGNYQGQFAVRWDADTYEMTPLDFIGANSTGISSATAYAINDSGIAVGSATAYVAGIARGDRAVRWEADSTAATQLGVLNTNSAGASRSGAYALNNAGTIVGYSNFYNGNTFRGMRAVLWPAGSTVPVELAHRGLASNGSTEGLAAAINNHGQIVGTSLGYDSAGNVIPDGGAAYWDADGSVYGLASLVVNLDGWLLFEGRDISDSGYITGYGRDAAGNNSAFLLIPIPEPPSLLLLAIGGLSLALMCRGRFICHLAVRLSLPG